MSDEPIGINSPTLKIRVAVDTLLGDDAFWIANLIAAGKKECAVLDAQWSHHPVEWELLGRGWDRPKLPPGSEAIMRVARDSSLGNSLTDELIKIIQYLVGEKS